MEEMEEIDLAAVEQVKLVATDVIGVPTDIKKLRDRRLQGGLYTLYEMEINEMRFYAVDIYCGNSHACMMVDDEQIEQIFGFEALPDPGYTQSKSSV